MASPVAKSYPAASGKTLYAGRRAALTFDSVTINSEDGNVPLLTANQTMVVTLHGSGGQNYTTGRQYRGACSGTMAYLTHTEFAFYTVRGTVTGTTLLRPIDKIGDRETMYLGAIDMGTTEVRLITKQRLEAMMDWAKINIPNVVLKKTCINGGSMGGWGTLSFGGRRPDLFAAAYPDRPRWKYNGGSTNIALVDFDTGITSILPANAPNVTYEDGANNYNYHMDHIAYVSDTGNKIPWIGWVIGWADGYTARADHVAAVAAMRAAKRGFAFWWDAGGHDPGTRMDNITASYPFGTFEIGKGYPLFTEHSLDSDPAVADTGGINIGLKFQNVVETATGWSCEVTHISTPCTVKVEPLSEVFVTPVTAQLVNITVANTWVPVSFSA